MLKAKIPSSITINPQFAPDLQAHAPPPTPQNIVNEPLPKELNKPPPTTPQITEIATFTEPPLHTKHPPEPSKPRIKRPKPKPKPKPAHIYEGEDHATKPAETTEPKKETPPNSKQNLLYGLQDVQHETIHKGEIHPEQPELHIISERHPKHHKGAGWHSILSIENHHPRKPHIDDLKKVRYQSKHHLKQAVLKRLINTRRRSHIPYNPNPLSLSL